MRLVRRLVREQADTQEHNDYLVKTNSNLTEENIQLHREVETLRWRLGDEEKPPLPNVHDD